MTPYDRVKLRARERCEAMVLINGRYARCFRLGVEVHHMLTRARGGKILDNAGETAHLIALCPSHHRWAHGPSGREAGLLIDGYVTTGPDGSPVYEGADGRLAHWSRQPGTVEVPDLRSQVCSD